LGGSFGVAILATYLGNKTVQNKSVLASHLSNTNLTVLERLNQMTVNLVAKGMKDFHAKKQVLAIF
tara:strand:+ start:329 stop:526 length:198 start_codon:yes stop_codon:yes gene_type:complete